MNNCFSRHEWMSLSNFFIIKQKLGSEPKYLLFRQHNVLAATPAVKDSCQGVYQVYHEVYLLQRISFSTGLLLTHCMSNSERQAREPQIFLVRIKESR